MAAPTTITLVFVHDHDCEHKDGEVKVYPRIINGSYYAETLVCIESGKTLSIAREEKA